MWGPVLLQMALIFFFSAQPKGSPVLEGFPLPAGMGHFIGAGCGHGSDLDAGR